MGLLDLPAPLLALIDTGLSWPLPAAGLRIALYGVLSGVLCMAIYRRCSRQQELAELAAASKRLRRELAGYDGPFQGLKQRALRLMKLNGRHLRLSLVPALLASLPLLFVMPWLSNRFGLQVPDAGTVVTARARDLSVPFEHLTWQPPALTSNPETLEWRIAWPPADGSARLVLDQDVLLRLAAEPVAPIVHRKVPVWNHLVGNPAGYLPPGAPVFAIELDIPKREMHRAGPTWLRGWLPVYLVPLIGISLVLKWRWRLH